MDDSTNILPSNTAVTDEIPESVQAEVKRWTKRIRDARSHWKKDYERMRDDMNFAAGIQWEGQEAIESQRYVVNLVLRSVNQKVSHLYARDPKAIAKRRRREDFQIWDGRQESLLHAQEVLADPGMGPDVKLAATALLTDYAQGRAHRDMVDKIGRTLEIIYKWQCDNQQLMFKLQMKQLVRRVVTCGVGYVRVNFSRGGNAPLSSQEVGGDMLDQLKSAKRIVARVHDGEIQDTDPEMEDLKMLSNNIAATLQNGELQKVQTRLIFDFPSASSIIPDISCSCLKGFVGAKWIAQQHLMTVEEVNAFFNLDLDDTNELVQYYPSGEYDDTEARMPLSVDDPASEATKKRVCLFEVFDKSLGATFFILDGYKGYIKPPEPVAPQINCFWPVFALTFNDIEVESGNKATVFPPSDVRLIRHAQKEWNRSREALREQRKANAPRYIAGKGFLTEDDKSLLESTQPNRLLELQGIPPGTNINDVVAVMRPAPIDPMAYDVGPQTQDMFLSLGTEEGPQAASNKATATAATINEQSRIVTASSNVDDLDDLLSQMAQAGGEILIREMQKPEVIRIAGPGAVWPELDKEDYLNYLYLDIVASSSGRPNRALEIANFQMLAPTLIAAGANPNFILRETIKRLDDRLDPDEAFPLGTPQPMAMQPQAQAQPSMRPPAQGQASAPTMNGQMPSQHLSPPHPTPQGALRQQQAA
jgi:hypothetical protein